eukprot:SAG11_NODE_22526_length_404_cov_1.324590_1_plen_118_part_01
MSERTLGDLHSECARVRRCALDVKEELTALRRLQRTRVSSRAARRAGLKEGRAWKAAVVFVAELATKLTAMLSRALVEAVREAEWGTWWEDLPGGSTWLEAVAAAIGVDAQLGGDAGT